MDFHVYRMLKRAPSARPPRPKSTPRRPATIIDIDLIKKVEQLRLLHCGQAHTGILLAMSCVVLRTGFTRVLVLGALPPSYTLSLSLSSSRPSPSQSLSLSLSQL